MEYYETALRNKNRGYMRLVVWQKAMQLFELWTIAFVESKIDFRLRSQIAEGYGRRSVQEFDALRYEAEDRLLKLIEKVEQKRDDDNWTARSAEDPFECLSEAPLRHFITLSLHRSNA